MEPVFATTDCFSVGDQICELAQPFSKVSSDNLLHILKLNVVKTCLFRPKIDDLPRGLNPDFWLKSIGDLIFLPPL